jgi:hypothetical protein
VVQKGGRKLLENMLNLILMVLFSKKGFIEKLFGSHLDEKS